MKALCHMARIRSVSFKIEATTPVSLDMSMNVMETPLYSLAGDKLGTIRELLFARWNEAVLPSEVGRYEKVEFVGNPVKVHTDGKFAEANVYARLEVAHGRYVGEFTDSQVAVLTGESQEEVEMPDITHAWEELGEDAPDPEARFVFTSVSQY